MSWHNPQRIHGRCWGQKVDIVDRTEFGWCTWKFFLGGGNSNIFWIFTPKLGEDSYFDEHIFRRGWNHQTSWGWIWVSPRKSTVLLMMRWYAWSLVHEYVYVVDKGPPEIYNPCGDLDGQHSSLWFSCVVWGCCCGFSFLRFFWDCFDATKTMAFSKKLDYAVPTISSIIHGIR